MSVISERSPKHCANKQANIFHNNLFFYSSTLIFLTILSLILLLCLILHPKPPQFSLKQATITQPNAAAPASIQITLLSANPNKNAGIYYDDLLLHASCSGQIITTQTAARPFYQQHQQTDILNASLMVGNQVVHGRYAGKLEVDLKVTGKLRWRLGNWVSGRYGFGVNCAAVVSFGHAFAPSTGEGAACSTSV